jgi:RNA polymerase sigma factor (sigma-70 family)
MGVLEQGVVRERATSTGPPGDVELVRRAAAGDYDAFSALYERHEPRVWGLCYRITASAEDAADATQDVFVKLLEKLPGRDEPVENFSAYVFAVARNASYDLIERRRRADPVEAVPERSVAQLEADPVPPEDDPVRAALLEASRDQVSVANARIDPRHREVLALREAEELSYDEIADIMGLKRNAVAQLILRARIALRRELMRGAAAAIASASPACERALPLICARQDGERLAGGDADWLEAHLRGCDRCRLSGQELEEAGRSYRSWIPIPALLGLKEATAARAAEACGFQWGGAGATHTAGGAGVAKPGGGFLAAHKGGVAIFATAIVGVVGGGAVVVAGDDEPSRPASPAPLVTPTGEAAAAERAERRRAEQRAERRADRRARRRAAAERAQADAQPAETAAPVTPAPAPQATPAPPPAPQPAPAPTPAPAPAPEPDIEPQLDVDPGP